MCRFRIGAEIRSDVSSRFSGDVGKELKNLITLMDQEEAEERRQQQKSSLAPKAASRSGNKSPAKIAGKSRDNRESPV